MAAENKQNKYLGRWNSSYFANRVEIDVCFIKGILHLLENNNIEVAKEYLSGMLSIAQGDLSFDLLSKEVQESGTESGTDVWWRRCSTIARNSVIKTLSEDMEFGRFDEGIKTDELPF